MPRIKKEAIVVKPSDFNPSSDEFEVIGTINPAAVRLPNGEILLYVRIIEKLIKDEDASHVYSPRMTGRKDFRYKIDRFSKSSIAEKNPLDFVFKDGTKRLTFISHLRRVILDSGGFKVKSIEQKPFFFGVRNDGEFGIEDPRITKLKGEDIMTYVTLSKHGDVSVSYALSKDLKNWQRKGVMFQEQNKDVVVFPEKIKEHYVAINRPEGNFQFSSPHMWLSYSEDLRHWGHPNHLVILKSRGAWDSGRVGVGPPPIKTRKGWLVLYHAVREKEKKDNSLTGSMKSFLGIANEFIIQYNVGAMLLKLENPSDIIMKSKEPLFSPTRTYEKGTFEKKDVIFPTGIVLSKNKKELLIYSGAGDNLTEVKKVDIAEIMEDLGRF